jgi:hypothetical protein
MANSLGNRTPGPNISALPISVTFCSFNEEAKREEIWDPSKLNITDDYKNLNTLDQEFKDFAADLKNIVYL